MVETGLILHVWLCTARSLPDAVPLKFASGTSANIFLIRGQELATPDLACAILAGTTRSWILAWAERVGLQPVEGWLVSEDLARADEAFLCSSVAGILPVTRIDGTPIGTGLPGPWTRTARAAREAFIRDPFGGAG